MHIGLTFEIFGEKRRNFDAHKCTCTYLQFSIGLFYVSPRQRVKVGILLSLQPPHPHNERHLYQQTEQSQASHKKGDKDLGPERPIV